MENVRTVPLYGSPEGVVFGTVGSLVEMADGVKYVKKHSDSYNIGWEAYNVTPTPTSTSTPTPTPTPTPTSGGETPTPTPTSTPTPTPTSTAPSQRIITVSPPVNGKSLWDFDLSGSLAVSGYGTWTIAPVYSSFVVNCDINGAAGGKGGDDSYTGGAGSKGSRTIGSFTINGTYYLKPGGKGTNGDSYASGGTGGGAGGLGWFSGGKGGNAGNIEFSGGGGGGGAASVILNSLNAVVYGAGGGGGGGGGGGSGYGQASVWTSKVFSQTNGTDGADKGDDDGGGGGGGGAGGGVGGGVPYSGDVGGEAGTVGGGSSGISQSSTDGYIILYV